jgi:flavin-binding protein dodecin
MAAKAKQSTVVRGEVRAQRRSNALGLASVAKIAEISAESPASFDDAVRAGIERASQTLERIQGAWIKEQSVVVEDGRIARYRVHLKLTFILQE